LSSLDGGTKSALQAMTPHVTAEEDREVGNVARYAA
jgi:hypothetical protein